MSLEGRSQQYLDKHVEAVLLWVLLVAHEDHVFDKVRQPLDLVGLGEAAAADGERRGRLERHVIRAPHRPPAGVTHTARAMHIARGVSLTRYVVRHYFSPRARRSAVLQKMTGNK